jgi:prepilin-type N-terminal cleavage/methylation domain-containing protein
LVAVLKEIQAMPGVRKADCARGFTLLETIIALVVLVVGILGLAAALGQSLTYMQNSEFDFIAQEKAQEATEAIFTAKYTNQSTWGQISNFSAGNPTGLFLTGPQPLLLPGATDGLFGTINDSAMPPDYILEPGPDGKLGTPDDERIPLSTFTRTITITNVLNDPNLRQIQVTVSYKMGLSQRSYTLNTFISAFN